jgi:hypothetical protein
MIRSKSPIFVFVGLILIVCNGCQETQEKHFANLAAAQQEHMVDKGWIPTYVSPDAKDISIEGDLDAATVNGSYTSGDASLLRMHCSSAEDSFRVPGYGPNWFSDDVEQADTAGKLRQKGYEVLRCQDGFNVVVLSSRQFVYYWSVRK